MNAIVPSRSDREALLAEKRRHFELLESQCSDHELELRTFSADIASFRNRYYLRVGVLYAQLDDIRAKIQKLLVGENPTDSTAWDVLQEAIRRAKKSADEVNDKAAESESTRFSPSQHLKDLYRQAAKLIHPDRASDEEDRILRDRLMAELNQAYRRHDAEAIAEIVEQYKDRLAVGELGDCELQIKRLDAMIEKTLARISQLEHELAEQRASEWCNLRQDVLEGEEQGRDPLGDLADQIYLTIRTEQDRLASLLRAGDDISAADPKTENENDAAKEQGEPKPHAAQYEPTFRPEGLIHRTERGDMVRSKSEVIIANVLCNLHMDYRYEYPIEGGVVEGVRRPDFAFLRPGRRPILWEHLGMLGDASYAASWERKRDWYAANGFVEGRDLFITRDDLNGGLDSRAIREVAGFIKSMLES